ncbi:hypothetical protein [Deferribacter desulfuricans]|uniref:hypothetical protein n=1 Tax=Deferribacter desulfuricans TaxID=197162 RepID=UPI0002FEBC7C|nr:hypothetical protein [Deferribacter desulfuricans]
MGCPDAIRAHLAGLQDVKNIVFDIESRDFEMTVDNDFTKEKLINELKIVSKQEKREFTLDTYHEVS